MDYQGYSSVRDLDALVGQREFREQTIDTLTEAVNRELRKAKSRERVSRSKIGHLCSGHQRTTSCAKAKAIEKALDVKIGALFVHNVVCSTGREDEAA